MTIIRIIITVTSFLCFVAWLIWFLKRDNKSYYQARALDLINDDDTTPTVLNINSANKGK